MTKWPEVFATKDQSALTIAQLFVREIVCRHGVPAKLLSDRGAAFLSQLMTSGAGGEQNQHHSLSPPDPS